jgi:hypothetical protein
VEVIILSPFAVGQPGGSGGGGGQRWTYTTSKVEQEIHLLSVHLKVILEVGALGPLTSGVFQAGGGGGGAGGAGADSIPEGGKVVLVQQIQYQDLQLHYAGGGAGGINATWWIWWWRWSPIQEVEQAALES